MLIEDQLVEVKIVSKNYKHFEELGYDVQNNNVIFVPPCHLTKGSHSKVDVRCDICGVIVQKVYKNYLREHEDGIDICKKCIKDKARNTMLKKYGVEHALQNDDIKAKMKQTNLEKYGVEYISQVDDVKEKIMNTLTKKYGYANLGQIPDVKDKIRNRFLEKYGCENPFMTEEVKEKSKQTCIKKYGKEYYSQSDEGKIKIKKTNMEKYGVESTLQCKEVREKIKQTNLIRYGVENPLQNFEIQQKARRSLMENGSGKASSQQIQLYEIIQKKYPTAVLNYPFGRCLLDIFVCIDNTLLDIEYDGSYWHQDKQHDIKRDKFLQANGFKTLRIRSGHLLPTEDELFDAINYLIKTNYRFKEIILADWKEVDQDESLLNTSAIS